MKRAAQGKDTTVLYNGQAVLPGRLQRTKEVVTEPQFPISAMLSLPTEKYDIIGAYVPFGNSLYVRHDVDRGTLVDTLQFSELENAVRFTLNGSNPHLDSRFSRFATPDS